MKLFLGGGGAGKQTELALAKLNEVISHDKKALYIPLAMKEEKYDSCYEWITGELASVDILGIDMVRSADELTTKNFADYAFIFIGGGNTFKLLHLLKQSGNFARLNDYLSSGGVVFGGSAGAIIFGKDIKCCEYMDENKVGLKDTTGFGILGDISIAAHYTNGTQEETQVATEALLRTGEKIFAIPEEDTIFVDNNSVEMLGTKPYYIIEDGKVIKCEIEDALSLDK